MEGLEICGVQVKMVDLAINHVPQSIGRKKRTLESRSDKVHKTVGVVDALSNGSEDTSLK